MKRWHASWVRLRPVVMIVGVLSVTLATAQGPALAAVPVQTPAKTTTEAVPAPVPADYVIGPEDVLTINFRGEPEISGDVTVRPDGKISLPIVKDIVAAGLTIEELRANVTKAAGVYLKEPTVSVQSKQINSRKVYVVGEVNKQGAVPHLGPMDVVELIALAGGLTVYAKQDEILIIRTEHGKQTSRIFNYDDVKKGKKLEQNIQLMPGDRVIVP